jgi:hypothetical protein
MLVDFKCRVAAVRNEVRSNDPQPKEQIGGVGGLSHVVQFILKKGMN